MGLLRANIILVVIQATVMLSFALNMPIISHREGNSMETLSRREKEVRRLYEEWMVMHNKSYSTLEEKERRFEIFKDNLHFINEHNHPKNNHSYTVGLNHLADLTNQEYRSTYLMPKINMSELITAPISNRYKVQKWDKLHKSIDWRSRGAVGPVKNQGICESCWAFSAVATVEGLHQIITGDLITLSEQELVDCDKSNNGCHRGFPHKAYQYIMTHRGIDTDMNYPYISQNGVEGICKRNRVNVVSIDRYEYGPLSNENAIMKAVANHPVSVAIDSSGQAFRFYQSGIFTGPCRTDIDHAVTIVGYGTENSMDYWTVKNSFSDRWGEGGYIRVQRNVAGRHGTCGIAKYFTYPVKRGYPMTKSWTSKNVHVNKDSA